MQFLCCCRTQQIETIHFHPVTLEDKRWVDRILRLEDSRSTDFCFTSILVWNDTYHQQLAAFGDRLLYKLFYHGAPFYGFPVGRGPLRPVICALYCDAETDGVPLKISGITAQNYQALEEEFPGQFEFTADTFAFDYVYEAESLATLAGKKLSAKRNHINRFIENNPDWAFEPIRMETLLECVFMTREWARHHQKDETFAAELLALDIAFANYDALRLEGGLIRSGGKVVAFAIGEPINSDTYIVHFEKAFSDIQGAYPMINREFARWICATHPHIRYINREDDLGIESLQRAKRSYYPVFMVEKYSAVWKGAEPL
ncbi:MAG: phosphatidylglycerol lysyltransferase domain-containing protein [Oscillospiraceae bacterium]|nr:phosphatidylglycerol lysyltransferase domain-containing protein [Oscillospiraceae bacterium]